MFSLQFIIFLVTFWEIC